MCSHKTPVRSVQHSRVKRLLGETRARGGAVPHCSRGSQGTAKAIGLSSYILDGNLRKYKKRESGMFAGDVLFGSGLLYA